ncbi:MAG: hypothetical protein KJ667_07295, partial [Alphaproteobacteria bacterium]|nr:hypothetical protein [Alphaproteobacteria bacterium]
REKPAFEGKKPDHKSGHKKDDRKKDERKPRHDKKPYDRNKDNRDNRDDRVVASATAKQNADDSPFAILNRLKVGQKE